MQSLFHFIIRSDDPVLVVLCAMSGFAVAQRNTDLGSISALDGQCQLPNPMCLCITYSVTPADQMSTLNPEKVSKPLAISGGWKAGEP